MNKCMWGYRVHGTVYTALVVILLYPSLNSVCVAWRGLQAIVVQPSVERTKKSWLLSEAWISLIIFMTPDLLHCLFMWYIDYCTTQDRASENVWFIIQRPQRWWKSIYRLKCCATVILDLTVILDVRPMSHQNRDSSSWYCECSSQILRKSFRKFQKILRNKNVGQTDWPIDQNHYI